jgi:hypothetical protein
MWGNDAHDDELDDAARGHTCTAAPAAAPCWVAVNCHGLNNDHSPPVSFQHNHLIQQN